MLTQKLLGFTLLGSEWVLWLLIVLSVLSVTIMVERGLTLRGAIADLDALGKQVITFLGKGDVAAARVLFGAGKSPESRVALAGLAEAARGADAVSEAMAGARTRERLSMERNLGVLGTLGNNAPFIGLFGTVLGIIRAFADLARNQAGGATVVMTGISEALVATAVGLMVAIPAVVAYNIFQGRVRRTLGRIDATAHVVLSGLKGGAPSPAAGERA